MVVKSISLTLARNYLSIANRLPFGISSAAAIFKRAMDSLLQGISSTAARLDDVIDRN